MEIPEFEKNKNSLHSLSPYVGKIRAELADWLIKKYATNDGYIYDPFSGSGTVLLEGWKNCHPVIGSDLNYYAYILSLGKLHPYTRYSDALAKLSSLNIGVKRKMKTFEQLNCPDWVSAFFHPETLKEIECWCYLLKRHKEWFILANLMGILHHQRSGFLSYPSSHGAPYLRNKKYPPSEYPDLYSYRDVYSRLMKKLYRSYSHMPEFDYSIPRVVINKNAAEINFHNKRISTIITSPPYMKSLTYARDNRLRLWFLGIDDWKALDKQISPNTADFWKMFSLSVKKWAAMQSKGDKCIIIIGDMEVHYENRNITMPEACLQLLEPKYKLLEYFKDPIPEEKKMVRRHSKIKEEMVLIFERK